MSKANEIQVGGTHYRNQDQHWDLAAECELGYFEGQITKYVTRHRAKNGKQDALKAQHFTSKLMELAQAGKRPQSAGVTTDRIEAFAVANALLEIERDILYAVINWSEPFVLGYALIQLGLLIEAQYPAPTEADALRYRMSALYAPKVLRPSEVVRLNTVGLGEDPADAGAGYVNQDR